MRRKSIIGALALCALCFGAVGVANASAENITAYICTEAGAGSPYADSHCTTKTGGNFKTVELTEPTKFTSTSTGTATLAVTIAGNEIEIVCHEWDATGTVTNEGTAKVSGLMITYSTCTVPKPAGCTIPEGKITTTSLKATASMANKEDTNSSELFEPEEGTTFASITFEGCTNSSFNGTKKVTGKATALVDGSEITTEGTAGGELKFGGQVATFNSTGHTVKDGTDETIALETP